MLCDPCKKALELAVDKHLETYQRMFREAQRTLRSGDSFAEGHRMLVDANREWAAANAIRIVLEEIDQ